MVSLTMDTMLYQLLRILQPTRWFTPCYPCCRGIDLSVTSPNYFNISCSGMFIQILKGLLFQHNRSTAPTLSFVLSRYITRVLGSGRSERSVISLTKSPRRCPTSIFVRLWILTAYRPPAVWLEPETPRGGANASMSATILCAAQLANRVTLRPEYSNLSKHPVGRIKTGAIDCKRKGLVDRE
jgi:hypothetical protein